MKGNGQMRKKDMVTITVQENGKTESLKCERGQTLMDALIANGYYFSACCGGVGNCGKCKVQVLEGAPAPTPEDIRRFTEKELAAGWRLSCKAVPRGDCRIVLLLDDEASFEAAAETVEAETEQSADSRYGIACDIGTTTIAMSLVNMASGGVCAAATRVNHQRMYGADVISRIQASNDGKGETLQKSIREDLCQGVRELLRKGNISQSQVQHMVLAGNTTMGHLLMGYSCETLGVAPFTPVNISEITDRCETILGEAVLNCPVTLMPGISTYVGADILAGILACGMSEREETTLLIDLGTNGEMAVGNQERLLVTSTAAGPAFEGGHISCGMGSVQGAISGVKIRNGQAEVTTIGDKPPVGLCGTGVIETIAELVQEKLVDETGLLDENLEDGFLLGVTPQGEEIRFTERDVREVQLAKAAVRAGMETLLLRYGITPEQVDTIYLAGGFGLKIDQEKAIAIGMLPAGFRGKIDAVGNTSLQGAIRYLLEAAIEDKAEAVIRNSQEVCLAEDQDFTDRYVEYMLFEA